MINYYITVKLLGSFMMEADDEEDIFEKVDKLSSREVEELCKGSEAFVEIEEIEPYERPSQKNLKK